ncbi:MAG: PAS domain S-box protein [Deltaproteobacteria bacterium]|nr:PAS domain S-box protein [Deltaproteobacteria bacterium]
MRVAPQPENEEERLEVLRATGLLDTPPDPEFDGLAELAARILEVPVALVSLVDRDRQWFKARVGLKATETPRDRAFCAHAILKDEPLVVPDAHIDERFSGNPLVIGDPHVRFYAGVPLATSTGHALGTLCVIDRVPRTFEPKQLETLQVLARQVTAQAELRMRNRQLSAARDELSDLFATATDLIQSVSADGAIAFVNRSWCERLGYCEDEVVGRKFWTFFVRSEQDKCRSIFHRLLGGELLPTIETAFVTKQQARVEVEGRVSIHRRPGAAPTTFGVFRDVTDRKRWETERARFFSLSLELMAVYRSDGSFTRLNPAWERVLGYSANELAEVPPFGLLHPADVEGTKEAFQCLVHGQPTAQVDSRWRSKDGSYRWLSWTAALSGQDETIYATARDVTDRRVIEDQIRAQAELLELTHDAILIRELDGRIRLWNLGAQKIFGYSAEEALGRDAAELLATRFPRPRAELEAELRRVGRWDGVLEKVAKDGRVLSVSSRWVLSRDQRGQPELILETMSDVTHRMAVERMKSEFVSTVSHELRTPLTSILGSLRLIEAGAAGPVPDKIAALIRIAYANSERLLRLVNDLLDLERVESGHFVLSPNEVEASALVTHAIDGTRGMADQLGISFVTSVPSNLLVRADPDRIVQALTNLLSNAVKWSTRGQEVRVEVTRGSDGSVKFAVRDRGSGIPPEKLPLLFGRFQQLDGSDARPKGGTGLGLAIAKAIVEQHGGRIGVRSDVGRGTEFWFVVP